MAALCRLIPLRFRVFSRTYSTFTLEGIGGSLRHFSDQKVLKIEDEVIEDEVKKIRRELDAAKESFLRIPHALKSMPKMNPEDFDLTCIVVDPSAILAAIVTALKSDQSPTYSQITWMSFTDLRNTWSDFPRQYTEEYEQCIETILSANKGRFFKSAGDIVEVRFAQTVMVVTCEWAWWLRQHICIRESMFYQWSNQWIAL
ncbi:uncharacterized protein [Spinacia oleracea]|uniref:Uncharacterized protein n=1 Tax=Spinacia oleracea TaxID=3562 RepID=A0ABM3QNR8_SPIOL|nr:uncharacterized protein LOC130461091 [Spinacia oleracea]